MTDEQAAGGDSPPGDEPHPGDEPPLMGVQSPTTEPRRPAYKGAPLDAARGPGLGCFWIQVGAFLGLFLLTPYGVINGWPAWLTTAMLIAALILLLFVGQTVIFLLRLVAADRRSRRRPLREGARPTVGDLSASAPEESAAGEAREVKPPEPDGPPETDDAPRR